MQRRSAFAGLHFPFGQLHRRHVREVLIVHGQVDAGVPQGKLFRVGLETSRGPSTFPPYGELGFHKGPGDVHEDVAHALALLGRKAAAQVARDVAEPAADFQDDSRFPVPPTMLLQLLRQQTPVGEPSHRRSEEHTSELQSQSNLVCRLLLEKKKKKPDMPTSRLGPKHKEDSTAKWTGWVLV